MDDTPVVVVVGPRQSGKSTLAELLAGERGARQVTLDDAGPRAAANADPTGFVEALELPVVIDEFQKAVELLPAIKSRVDRARSGGRRAAGMFLLTGSANVWATLRVSESLAGRAERLQLWPLSQGEILGGARRSSTRCSPGTSPRSLVRPPAGAQCRGLSLPVGIRKCSPEKHHSAGRAGSRTTSR